MRYERQPLAEPDPITGLSHSWTAYLEDGRQIPWSGLQTGPLVLSEGEVGELCRHLLGHGIDALEARVAQVLRPASGAEIELPALILHSTTPELRTFDGDLDALVRGGSGGDFTTYKEARSVYLARPGDVAVGRTGAWKAAVRAQGAEGIELEDRDHYYLSHALLHLAGGHRRGSGGAMERLVACLVGQRRVVRLYAFEPEMQIFLLWLARAAGLEELVVEANRPALSAAWNRKDVLHPTVAEALALAEPAASISPSKLLELESQRSTFTRRLDLMLPSIPGYAIERQDRPVEDFVDQLLRAAELLQRRYGLGLGCLKASESGDGARITPGLDLRDRAALSRLGREAHRHGDDYVLEAHVTYGQASVAGQTLPTALSAHIRGGQAAPGATIQFVEGTSWKGNALLDEDSVGLFAIPDSHYRRMRHFLAAFQSAFEQREPGLVLAGIDFAIGKVGGVFGESLLLGVQDLNISFTGAECLRAFLDKARRAGAGHSYGVTRIYRPRADQQAFLDLTTTFCRGETFADTVASIPGRWGMVGITGRDPQDAIDNLSGLERALLAEGLIEQP